MIQNLIYKFFDFDVSFDAFNQFIVGFDFFQQISKDKRRETRQRRLLKSGALSGRAGQQKLGAQQAESKVWLNIYDFFLVVKKFCFCKGQQNFFSARATCDLKEPLLEMHAFISKYRERTCLSRMKILDIK